MDVRVKIIRIGNSQGIRIPKPILQQCEIGDEVELEILDQNLIIRAVNHPRKGWEDKFRQMSESGDDKLFLDDRYTASGWDEEEWEW